jgi:hypothetical protein
MSSIGDLSISISADASQVTSGMTETRNQLSSTTEVIHTQQTSWASFGLTIVGAMANTIGPIISFINFSRSAAASTVGMSVANLVTIPSTLTLAAAINACIWPLTLIVVTIAAVVAAYYLLVGSSEEAATATASASAEMTSAATVSNSYAESMRAAMSANADTIPQYQQLESEIGKFSESLASLGNTITQPFIDGAAAVVAYIASFSPLPSLAGMAAAALSGVTATITGVKDSLAAGGAAFAVFALSMSGTMSADAAQSFLEEGRSLTSLTAATEAQIAKMEGLRSSYANFGAAQKAATASAASSAAVSAVGKLFDVASIDAATAALRARAVSARQNGEANKEFIASETAMLDALARQRQGVEDGTIVDRDALAEKSRIAKEEKRIADEAAATKEKQASEFKRINEELAADTLKSQMKIGESFGGAMQKLNDSISLLDGSASKATIQLRELTAQGFSEEQIASIAAAQDELKNLEDQKESTAKAGDTKGPAANLKGSAGALSAIFAASRNPLQERQVKLAEQTLTEAQAANALMRESLSSGAGDVVVINTGAIS